jgi:hypothetical protein
MCSAHFVYFQALQELGGLECSSWDMSKTFTKRFFPAIYFSTLSEAHAAKEKKRYISGSLFQSVRGL